jgi:hypothetical protein
MTFTPVQISEKFLLKHGFLENLSMNFDVQVNVEKINTCPCLIT